MNIAADALLVLLIPMTVITNVALRETKRVHGPDIMGPAFMTVVTSVIRWIGMLIIIGLVVGGGSFDAAIPNRGLQMILMAAILALVEWAAGITVIACAPSDASAGPTLIASGRFLSFAIPILTILWLMPVVHGFVSRAGAGAVFTVIACICEIMALVFDRVHRKTTQQKNAMIRAYWQNQRKLTEQGQAEIAALPLDCPLEALTRYIVEPSWPADVRGDAFVRLQARPDIAEELLTMLTDEQRRPAALQYLQRLSSEPAPAFNAKLRDFSSELAQKWKARGPNLSDRQVSLLAADCEGFIHVAYGRHSETLSFFPAMDSWREAMGTVPDSPAIIEARKNLDHWFELNPRPAVVVSQRSA